MNLSCPAVFIALASLTFALGAGEALHESPRVGPVRIEKLRTEIAALDAQARGDSPEFEAELREWEARMAESPEWSVQKGDRRPIPGKIGKILAVEPSE